MEAAAQEKHTEKSGKQRALQMPGASELCGLEERFAGLRGRGSMCPRGCLEPISEHVHHVRE